MGKGSTTSSRQNNAADSESYSDEDLESVNPAEKELRADFRTMRYYVRESGWGMRDEVGKASLN